MKDNPILPNRALYICDKDCGPTCDGCHMVDGETRWTSTIIHAKNGPVVNVREWDERFHIEEISGLLYYVENKS